MKNGRGNIMVLHVLLLATALFPFTAYSRAPEHPHDLDLLKFSCTRIEEQNGQRFFSEIHFVKAGRTNIPRSSPSNANSPSGILTQNSIEGEVLSYLVHDGEKTFISGYSLFSISYHDQIISGMTGDPMTTSDGIFSLTQTRGRVNGPWLFSHTGINGQHIEAEFNCSYTVLNLGL